jgi:hypothetical protein
MRHLAILTICLGTLLAACSTASISVPDYATAVEERAVAYADETDGLKGQQLATLEATVARLQGELDGQALVDAAIRETASESTKLFAGISDALVRYVQDLDAMAAPDVLSDAHVAYVSSLDASRAGLVSVLDDLPGATSFDEIDRVINGSGFADVQQRLEASCRSLENAIASQDLSVDLECEATR